jgi:hypothetical protein
MRTFVRHFIHQYWVLFILIAIKLILQFLLVNPVYELHRDEFLHLGQANHLAFGFISVPPFTSLVSRMIYLLGGGIFWVRFFPSFFGVLTIIFAWLTVERLDGKLYARILVSSALVFSVLMRLNILFQPNSFEILAWTMMFYLLVSWVKTAKTKWLIVCSVVIAIGFYNKYTIGVPLIGLFIGFLMTQERKLLFDKKNLTILILLILLVLPNLIWQFGHQFPVLHHMHRLKETQLDNNSSIGFLTSQLMFFFGSIPLIVAAIVSFFRFEPFKPYRFIGIGFIVSIALFAILKAKDYYATGLYPVMLAFGSVYLEILLVKSWKRYLRYALIAGNLVLFIVVAKYLFPVLSPSSIVANHKGFAKFGMLRWEDGKNHALPQDFSDMLGWKEMAQKSLDAYRKIPTGELSETLIFCDNYGQTGALNYYNRGKMPEAYSFNTDYIFWLPHLQKIKNVLLVGDKPDARIVNLFLDCKLVGKVENSYAREFGTEIYLLTDAKNEFTDLFYKLAEKRKADFDIF